MAKRVYQRNKVDENARTKYCPQCKTTKSFDEFSKNNSSYCNLASCCRICMSAYKVKHRARNRKRLNKKSHDHYHANKEAICKQRYLEKYGITIEERDAILANQGNVCWICGELPNFRWGKKLMTDHCHTTGVVRGMLCHYCNAAIGSMRDNPMLLERAELYLKVNGAGYVHSQKNRTA